MNRAFKTEFHNGEEDCKSIVTMSVRVNNGNLFKALNKQGRKNLILSLTDFKKSLEIFIEEIRVNHYNQFLK